jgi:hypothetical protein
MLKDTKLKHTAIIYKDRSKADIFFNKILGLEKFKSFEVSEKLSEDIFGIKQKVTIDVYSNEFSYIEVFISELKTKSHYEHICIEVENKDEFINDCKKYNLKPYYVKKGDRQLLFIRDFNDNLFEVKYRN